MYKISPDIPSIANTSSKYFLTFSPDFTFNKFFDNFIDLNPLIYLSCFVYILSGCTGVQTFSHTARAGETISATFSYGRYDLNRATRDNTVITIRDSAGVKTVYKPGDSRVKAIINMYPDPASYLIVAAETDQNFRSDEKRIASYIPNTGYARRDWNQMVAFFDLPETMAIGNALVTIKTDDDYIATTDVNVVAGTGTSNSFDVKSSPSDFTSLERLQSMERSPHHKVVLTGEANSVQAIDLRFSHNADIDNGGVGKAHIVNPRGDITSINWSDSGTMLHVLVTPAKEAIKEPKQNLLFYIAGGLTGLQLSSMAAVDTDANPVFDVGISMSPLIYALSPTGPLPIGTEV